MIIPSGKGQYFKIWDKVSIEKSQNEHHAVVMFLCVELCLLFCSWSARQQHEDAVPGVGAGSVNINHLLYFT